MNEGTLFTLMIVLMVLGFIGMFIAIACLMLCVFDREEPTYPLPPIDFVGYQARRKSLEIEERAHNYLVQIDKLQEHSFAGKECCICLDENEKQYIETKFCQHDDKYCKSCLVIYMLECVKNEADFLCPLCRQDILPEEDESELLDNSQQPQPLENLCEAV